MKRLVHYCLSVLSLFFASLQSAPTTTIQTQPKGYVVVTGATKGLGKALAIQFIRSGWKVAGCGRSVEAIQKLQSEYGSEHFFAVVDITNEKMVEDWANEVVRRDGAPNIVINNAALINEPAPVWKISPAEFRNICDTNVMGTFNVIRFLLPSMVERGTGLIVNVSSGWGKEGGAHVSPYCTTKFAVEGLTQSLAKELPQGMAAVTLDPGPMHTDMLRKFYGQEEASRAPSPEEVAKKIIPILLNIKSSDNGRALSLH